MLLLVPSDPLHSRRPDEHFAEEATAAVALGLSCALVDHDALVRGRVEEAVARVPVGEAVAVHRGWMMRAEHYALLEAALAARSVSLRTSAAMFRRGHELPGWYAPMAAMTPESMWSDGSAREDFVAMCKKLGAGPAVLRDFTKSMKHHWEEAAFIPDVADLDAAWKVAARFLALREEMFVRGFVLRRFEKLHTEEVRTWWCDGRCVLSTAHPDSPAARVPEDLDLHAIGGVVRRLGLPFVTVDLALRADGAWRVMELGDGQVSDRPRSTPATAFLRAVIPH